MCSIFLTDIDNFSDVQFTFNVHKTSSLNTFNDTHIWCFYMPWVISTCMYKF